MHNRWVGVQSFVLPQKNVHAQEVCLMFTVCIHEMSVCAVEKICMSMCLFTTMSKQWCVCDMMYVHTYTTYMRACVCILMCVHLTKHQRVITALLTESSSQKQPVGTEVWATVFVSPF